MVRILVVCCLLLASGAAFAQTQGSDAAVAPESSGLASPLLIGAGIVGGVVVADLLTGGTLTGPLFRGAETAAPRMFTPLQTREMTSAGALIGEAIAPATALRDQASRAEIWRLLALAGGGVLGWLGVSALISH
jgi:hypothetical protein